MGNWVVLKFLTLNICLPCFSEITDKKTVKNLSNRLLQSFLNAFSFLILNNLK